MSRRIVHQFSPLGPWMRRLPRTHGCGGFHGCRGCGGFRGCGGCGVWWGAAAAVYRGARASSARPHGRPDHAHEVLVGARTWHGFIAFSERACAPA